jgi:hypothetical protein
MRVKLCTRDDDDDPCTGNRQSITHACMIWLVAVDRPCSIDRQMDGLLVPVVPGQGQRDRKPAQQLASG